MSVSGFLWRQRTTLSGGQERPLVGGLQIDLLGQGERVVYLDSKVPDGALKLSVAEEQLAGAQVACLLVDEGDLGSPKAVGSVSAWLQMVLSV